MPVPRTPVVALLAFVTLAPLGMGAGGAPAAPTCETANAEAIATPTETLVGLHARYSLEPGFVDLYFDPATPDRVAAVFDLARTTGELPQGGRTGDLVIEVRGERFQELLAPPRSADPPVIPEACTPRISPGASISTPVGGCSLNFMFQDAAGKKYAGTAGHCFSALGQRMTVSGVGAAGTVVYLINAGVGNDFALVRIDDSKANLVNPAMCQWGGPTGPATGLTAGIVRHYGFGIGYGTTQFTRARSGYGQHSAGTSFSFMGAVASGDSGSGARLDNGLALGVITHVNGGAVIVGHSAPFGYGTKVTHAMQLAQAATGLQLTLLTAAVT